MIHLFKTIFFGIVFSLMVMWKAYAQQTPHELTPEGRVDGNIPPYSVVGNENAIHSTILYGILDGIVRISKAHETRTDLRGNCSYGEEDKPIRMTCNNAKANLLNDEKKVLVSTTTNENGNFRFFIPVGKSYFIQVVDRKGRTATIDKKVGRGNIVQLLLKP